MLNVILLLHKNVRKTYESKEPIKKKKKMSESKATWKGKKEHGKGQVAPSVAW